MNPKSRWFPLAALMALPGCASMTSHGVTGAPQVDDAPTRAGISYYLPKRMALASFVRAPIESDERKARLAADGAWQSAKERVAGLRAELRVAERQVVELKAAGIKPDDAIYKAAVARAADAVVAVAEGDRAAQLAHARWLEADEVFRGWQAEHGDCGFVDRFDVVLQAPVPDTRRRFLLEPRHSLARHDKISITTTPSGLLSTVDGTFEDQSAAIIVALAQGWTAYGGGGLGVKKFGLDQLIFVDEGMREADRCRAWRPMKVERLIDPAVCSDWKQFLGATGGTGLPVYSVEGDVCERQVAASPPPAKWRGDGVFYRRELPVEVDIMRDNDRLAGRFVLTVPNAAPAELLAMPASPFVTTEHGFAFDHGLLVSVDSTRPSEALSVVSIPWTVAQATMNVLTSLVKFRVDLTSGEADAVGARLDLLEQQQALLDAQREAQLPPGSGDAEEPRP